MKHVFFLVGFPQHGKSTVRRKLATRLGVSGGSCSDVIYPALAALWGLPEQALRAMPKESLRPQLVALGDVMTAHDAGRLVELSLGRGIRVLDGVRRVAEAQAGLLHARRLGFDPVVVLVTRTDAGAPVIRDNTEPRVFELANHYLTAGSLEELETNTDLLLAALGY